MLWTMGEDEIIRIGVTTFSSGDLLSFAAGAGAAAAFTLFPWVRWRWTEWRIGHARAQGRIDDANHLAFAHDEDAPKALSHSLPTAVFVLLFVPGLYIFQENLADDVGRMLGEGFDWAGLPLATGFVFLLLWMWGRIRRNMMSPEELAALEEEEEHWRWVSSIEGDGMAALGFGIAAAIIVLTTIVFLLISGLPG